MAVEELIGLEAATSELGSLYAVARQFSALRAPAEDRLLPRIRAVSAGLRKHLRDRSLEGAAVDAAAREIAALRAEWREKLDAVREGGTYRQALDASASGDSETLAALLPQIFAGLQRTVAPASLFLPVPIASHDRKPGTRPFVAESACAEKIASYRRLGVPVPTNGEDWWDTDFPYAVLFDDPEVLEAPVQVRFDGKDVDLPVFSVENELALRCYTASLRLPFSVSLQEQASDEWWEAFADTYGTYRDTLKRELERLDIVVEVRGR